MHPHIFWEKEKSYLYKWKWKDYFWNSFPLVLEIGTGMGNFFSTLVAQERENNYIGMEIRYKRLFFTAEKALKSCLQAKDSNINFAVLKNLWQNISHIFWENELSACYIFFPDPYCNKTSQLKHRLLGAQFLEDLSLCMQKDGILFFKTDHDEYFQTSLENIWKSKHWEIEYETKDYTKSPHFDSRYITEFEAMYRGETKNICFFTAKNRK